MRWCGTFSEELLKVGQPPAAALEAEALAFAAALAAFLELSVPVAALERLWSRAESLQAALKASILSLSVSGA